MNKTKNSSKEDHTDEGSDHDSNDKLKSNNF